MNLFHDSIDIWNCCNEASILSKEVIMKCLSNTIFAWGFWQIQIQKKKLAILCIAAVAKPKNLISKFQFHFFSLKDTKFLDKSISDKNKGSESTWMQVKLVYQNSYWLDIKTVIESFTTSFEGGILWWSDLVVIIYLKLFNRATFET